MVFSRSRDAWIGKIFGIVLKIEETIYLRVRAGFEFFLGAFL